MRDRKRHHSHSSAESDAPASAASTPKPPLPEAQGDGQPAAVDAEGQDSPVSGAEPASREVSELPASPAAAPADAELVVRLQDQLNEQLDKYLRLAAEYDNYRKRTLKERAEAASRGQAELVSRLTDALDDLSRFAHIDAASTDALTLHKGIELVEQKMLKVLGAAGLEVINPLDQTFDPTQHEAVATEPALAPEDDHTVARVFQPGYRFNGQLLRPARVVVKQWRG